MAEVLERETSGLTRRDLRKCVACRRGVMHAQGFTFYRVRLTRMAVDLQQVQQLHGLEQFMGGGSFGAVMADVMGPGGELAVPLGAEMDFLVCDQCAMGRGCLASLAEHAVDQLPEPEGGE